MLPAFARQWDDRQKANELQVALVSEVASATASGLSTGEALQVEGRLNEAANATTRREWSLSALRVEGRLRAYFPDSTLVTIWQINAYALGRFSGVSGGATERFLQDAENSIYDRVSASAGDAEASAEVGPGVNPEVQEDALPEPLWSDVTDLVHALNTIAKDPKRRATFSDRERESLKFIATLLPPYSPIRPLSDSDDSLEATLLQLQQVLTNQILASHPRGYSTSGRDLINDLLPF